MTVHRDSDRRFSDFWLLAIAGFIVVIAVLHYSTPIRLHHLHELYRVFFYVPIILAVYRYQIRGGVITSITIVAIYLPHVVFQWGGDFWFNFSRFLEMVMYLVIGIVAGVLAQRELAERRKYQQTAAELEALVQKLKTQSEQLAEIEEQLLHADRLSVLGELSASLAHEVRNPLGSIWGVVEILQDKLHCDATSAEFMGILVKEVQRLNAVVENYLSLAKRQQLQVKSYDLLELLQSVLRLLNARARKRQILITTEFPEHPLFIKADANQLQQVLINLLLNAMSAITAAGNITIAASEVALPVEDDRQRNNKHVQLSITDSGIGLTPEVRERMFKPFYTTKADGTGLGLSIVKRIVEQNKWTLHVASQQGAGTTMTLIFPLEDSHDGIV